MEVIAADMGGGVVTRQQDRRKLLCPLKVTTAGDGNQQEQSITKEEQEADLTLEGFLKHQRTGSSHQQLRQEGGLWYKLCMRKGTAVKQ